MCEKRGALLPNQSVPCSGLALPGLFVPIIVNPAHSSCKTATFVCLKNAVLQAGPRWFLQRRARLRIIHAGEFPFLALARARSQNTSRDTFWNAGLGRRLVLMVVGCGCPSCAAQEDLRDSGINVDVAEYDDI